MLNLSVIFILLVSFNLFAKEVVINPGPYAHERLQEAMILMNEGDTLIIESGYYSFEDGLSLDVDGVTVAGRGMEETILDFKMATEDGETTTKADEPGRRRRGKRTKPKRRRDRQNQPQKTKTTTP